MKPWLGEEEAEAAAAAVRSGWVAQGPKVAAFEDAFARRVAALHAVATSSCTTALHIALHLLDVRPGDEVVVPSLSFIATANAVRYCGATPVFADVEPETGNLSAATVEPVLTDRTRAVILVHQAGVPADVDPLRALCGPRGVTVVEDAACAAGSTYRGVPVGADAEVAAWSFHPRKLITTGEGGMLTTNRAEWATRGRRLREHGMSVSAAERHSGGGAVVESYLETAFNYRMTDIQAAVGLVQLSRLDAIVRRRRELADRYHDLLADVLGADVPGLRPVRDPGHGTTNYQSFWVMLPDDLPVERNDVLARLAERGVSARRGIMAAHLEPAYADHPRVDLPVTEAFTRRSLILPLYHDLTAADQDTVVEQLKAALHAPLVSR
ncbi:DegT/DnrJ/EryC1/StrS family aminotransferase [Saccharothrix hoggarensis]|uniref:DegT/DnrJ/EryC1/StrS family aminotransferase n=2 Tax=Saccharothrix hoggarensis TaxID=913853 RepID=A0ABW3QPT5_9PSEU